MVRCFRKKASIKRYPALPRLACWPFRNHRIPETLQNKTSYITPRSLAPCLQLSCPYTTSFRNPPAMASPATSPVPTGSNAKQRLTAQSRSGLGRSLPHSSFSGTLGTIEGLKRAGSQDSDTKSVSFALMTVPKYGNTFHLTDMNTCNRFVQQNGHL